jgi:hypothetical protein
MVSREANGFPLVIIVLPWRVPKLGKRFFEPGHA